MMLVLPNLIHSNQTTFLKGRRIIDSINLAQDFVQGFIQKNTSKCACVSIDFQKAFYTVRWHATDRIMELFGFNDYFREIVMSCVWPTSFSSLIEGSLTEILQTQRGILAPTFVMVVEYLSRLTRKAAKERQLEVYRIGGVQVEPHHAFANDIIFFCWA